MERSCKPSLRSDKRQKTLPIAGKLSDVTVIGADSQATSDSLEKRHARGRHLFWCTVIASVAAIIAIAWLLTNPSSYQGATLLACAATLLATIITLAIGIDTLGDRTGQIAFGVGVVALVGLVTVVASISGLLVNLKSYGVQSSWTSVVHREMTAYPTGPGECISPKHLDLAMFGDVDQVCIYHPGDSTTMLFRRGTTGLEYSNNSVEAGVPDECVAHIGGDWWRFNSADNNECPPGSHFVGGG